MGPGRSYRGLGDLSSESASSLSSSPLSSRESQRSNSSVSTADVLPIQSTQNAKNPINATTLQSVVVQQQLNDKQLKSLGEKECLAAGRIYRKQTEKRKSSCAKKPIPKGSLKKSCKKAGGIYRKSTRKDGKIVHKASCVYPDNSKSPRISKSSKSNIIFE